MPIPASAYSLYAPPWADLVPGATLAALNPGSDPNYAIANAQTDATDDTYRSDDVTDTITITLASPQTIIAVSGHNTNAEMAALRSDAGLNVPIAIDTPTLEGHPKDFWKWLGDESSVQRTSDVFYLDLDKTGVALLELGRLVLVTLLLELIWLPMPDFGHTRYGSARNRTKGGRVHRRITPWAPVRKGIGKFVDTDELSALKQLEQASNGLGQGFLVVENRLINEAMFMQVAEDAQPYRGGDSHIELTLPLEEIARGLTPECDWTT